MSCEPINRTPDEIRNAFINGNFLWDVNPDDPLDILMARLDFFQNNMVLPEGESQTYWIAGYNIKERVSSLAKGAFIKRRGKITVQKEVNKPDYTKKKNTGTRIHQILAEIMDYLYNNKGSLEDIRRRAQVGDYAVYGDNFNSLVGLVQEHIVTINKVQKSIDPAGKAIVRVEQKMASPLRNIGGALDVLIVFSDKTMGRIDYKTSHSNKTNFFEGNLTDELLSIDKVGDYELSMNEYGKILKTDIGFKGDRLVRLSPIHVRLEMKPEGQRGDYDIYTTTINTIEAGSRTSPFLKPVPISGEKTQYKGVDKLLEKQWILLTKLSKQITNKSISQSDREILKRKITSIRKSIQTTIIDGDISDIISSANLISTELNNRIYQTEFLEGGESNPNYLTDEELEELISELSLYKDIIENTHKYYKELKDKNPKLYDKLKNEISTTSSNVIAMLTLARVHSEERLLSSLDEYIDKSYKDEEGNLLPLEELDFFTRNFTRMSEINHPMFQAAWKMVRKAQYNMKQDLKDLDSEVSKVEKELFTWAKQHNLSREEALKKLINMESGMLVSDISKELMEKINKARTEPDIEKAYALLTDIYELKDPEAYKENYKSRFERFKETQVHKYNKGKDDPQYQKDLKQWIARNDLSRVKDAWSNEFNRRFLKIKDSVRNANLSEEYKLIQSNKPLLDYYNLYVKYNNLFRELLDISDYKKLPPTFIANIRKTMVDNIAMDKLNFAAAGREFLDSLTIREEDVFIGDIDETGQLRRTIPILFINPFTNKDGEIDNTKKSYDLSKNLMLFAKMAYNWKYMHEVEPKILQMREYMSNPTSEREGTKVVTTGGKTIAGKMSQWVTKKGLDTDTYKLFEELTDYYLYGIKFHENNVRGGKIDVTKTLMKAKQFYSKSTLGLAVIPAFGAYVAGNISSLFEGSKGISYNNKHMQQSHWHLTTDYAKYTSLALFYDVYSEDPTTKYIENKSANFWSKIATTRNLMYPLRRADELMNNSIANAMALNWGIDIEGKLGVKNALIRLNDPSRDTTGIRSIWELTTFDKTTGKVTIDGLTEDNYIAFRDAVKATSANIIGSLSQEDISRIDTNLLYNIMFQFKSWMPGVVRERTGKLIYDDKIQAAKWGRYPAAFAEFRITDKDFENGFILKQYISKIFLPNVAKFTLDLATFGAASKLGLVTSTYIDKFGKERKVRTNIDRAKRMYRQYILDNPHLTNTLTFEKYLEVKEAQMRAFTNEIRAILMFAVAIHLMGAGGDDGEQPPYMANWFSRFMYKNFTKAQSELTFMWSPKQLAQLIKNPIPLTGLLTRTINTTMNGMDEIRDMLGGENSLSDKTPMGYYTLQWIYGAGQTARLIELYKQYQKSPYVVTTGY